MRTLIAALSLALIAVTGQAADFTAREGGPDAQAMQARHGTAPPAEGLDFFRPVLSGVLYRAGFKGGDKGRTGLDVEFLGNLRRGILGGEHLFYTGQVDTVLAQDIQPWRAFELALGESLRDPRRVADVVRVGLTFLVTANPDDAVHRVVVAEIEQRPDVFWRYDLVD